MNILLINQIINLLIFLINANTFGYNIGLFDFKQRLCLEFWNF